MNIIRRRKRTILFSFLLSLSSLVIVGYFLRPVPLYQACAAITLEQLITALPNQNSESPSGEDFSRPKAVSLSTATSMLKNFRIFEMLAKRFDLIPQELKKEQLSSSPQYMAIIKSLEENISIERESKSSQILLIHFKHDNPVKAKDMANGLVEIFETLNLSELQTNLNKGQRVIEEKINQLEIERADQIELEKIKNLEQLAGLETGLKTSHETGLETGQGLSKNVAATSLHPLFNPLIDPLIIKQQQAMEERQQRLEARLTELGSLKEKLVLLDQQIGEKINEQMYQQTTPEANLVLTFHDTLSQLLIEGVTLSPLYTVEIVQSADLPRKAVNQAPVRKYLWLSLLFSFILALFSGLVSEAVERVPHTPEKLAKIMKEPLLITIPDWDKLNCRDETKKKYPGLSPIDTERYCALASHFLFDSPLAEQYRALVPTIILQRKERGSQVFGIIHGVLGEGGSIFAANVAIALSQTGRTTLLLEADFRHPTLHKLFGIESSPGLKNVLHGHCSWEKSVRKITDLALGEINPVHFLAPPELDTFYLLPSGGTIENPIHALNSVKMQETLRQMKHTFDFIILTVPPALMYQEALIAGARVDAVLLLAEHERLPKKMLSLLRRQLDLRQFNNVLGLVVNKV